MPSPLPPPPFQVFLDLSAICKNGLDPFDWPSFLKSRLKRNILGEGEERKKRKKGRKDEGKCVVAV